MVIYRREGGSISPLKCASSVRVSNGAVIGTLSSFLLNIAPSLPSLVSFGLWKKHCIGIVISNLVYLIVYLFFK